jgi:type II secretory ATPase GspE/PulE/Tfp pilus assembly ATPase PilB-like protein
MLHSILSILNTEERKIWTAEDPVEILQPGLRQVQVNPRAGLTFSTALRAFLRADPDVIMIGEMRDRETVEIAVQASLTGHLVLSTLHTNSAAETITRLLEMGVNPFTFSDALLGVSAQRLGRRLCEHCKQRVEATTEEIQYIREVVGEEELEQRMEQGKLYLYKHTGCPQCRDTGYKGRVGIFELLISSPDIAQAIRTGKSTEIVKQIAMKEGMLTLVQDGVLKALDGMTDLIEVQAVTGG